MKKIFLSVALSAMFLIGSLSMISMAPPPPQNTTCQALFTELENAGIIAELGLSKGDFLSVCNVCFNKAEGANNQAVCFCKLIVAEGDDAPGDNMGQCVNILKDEFGEQAP